MWVALCWGHTCYLSRDAFGAKSGVPGAEVGLVGDRRLQSVFAAFSPPSFKNLALRTEAELCFGPKEAHVVAAWFLIAGGWGWTLPDLLCERGRLLLPSWKGWIASFGRAWHLEGCAERDRSTAIPVIRIDQPCKLHGLGCVFSS